LDEAERCNRVGLMYRGQLIRCQEPATLRRELHQACYEVETTSPKQDRERLKRQPGVESVEVYGAALHVLASPEHFSLDNVQRELPQATFRQVVPSLEDVFISVVRAEEKG
jgi:ABC-2 type transport system ATP-binding protein